MGEGVGLGVPAAIRVYKSARTSTECRIEITIHIILT